jgi:hypothetical protein
MYTPAKSRRSRSSGSGSNYGHASKYFKHAHAAYAAGKGLYKVVSGTRRLLFGERKRIAGPPIRKARSTAGMHVGWKGPVKSAGIIRRPNRISKSQRKLGIIERKGVLYTKETGITVAGASVIDSFYVGHTTCPVFLYRNQMWRALIKFLAIKIGLQIRDINDDSNLGVGNTIQLLYKNDEADTANENPITYTYVAGDTWNIAATYFHTQANGITVQTWFPTRMNISTSKNFYEMNLLYTTVTYSAKSTLKMQNVTKGPLGAEADDVDNIPIYGRTYSGKGTGTESNRSKYNAEVSLAGDFGDGIIYKVGVTTAGTSEMPPASYFNKVTGTKKVKIEPGDIKTSVLSDKRTMKLQKFINQLYFGANPAKGIVQLGKFMFHGFEAMIKATSADPTLALKGEHNIRIGMIINSRNTFETDEVIEQNYVVCNAAKV